MRKVLTVSLVLVLVLFSTMGQAKTTQKQKLMVDMANVTESLRITLENFSSGIISKDEAVTQLKEYQLETTFILEKARAGDMSTDFIKTAVGLDMVVGLYRDGVNEMNPKKIELANKITTLVLIPRFKN